MAVEGGWFRDEAFTYSTANGAASQYYFVRSTAQFTATLCVGATGGSNRPVGVLQNDPTGGQGATVRMIPQGGYSKVSAGGTITLGDWLTCSTGGQAITTTTTGTYIIGYAVTASTAANQIITVDLGHAPVFYTAGASA